MCRSRLKPYNSASCITVRSPIIVRAPDSLRKLNRSRVIEASEFFNTIGRKPKFKLRHYQHRANLDVVASHVLALRQPRREAPKARDNQPGAPELDDAIPFG